MKIEIEVPHELIEKLGKEAVESYLLRKAERLLESLKNQSTEEKEPNTEDTESTAKAWQKFNKRGISC